MDLNTIRNHYGVLIMVITFSSRIIFVGFCWSYGTVLAEFKKQNTTLTDTELSWIGSIGQSFGGLLAPVILYFAQRYGYQIVFLLSLLTCVLSLLLSSLVRDLHWLLLTYSFPYGFANTAIYILGTLVCGLYYPASNHGQHVFVMCIISTGFPIGYHIMSAFVFSFIRENGWQSMKKRVALMEFAAVCLLSPFFTTACVRSGRPDFPRSITVNPAHGNQRIYYSISIIFWMLGIFFTMCAINNFLLHLHNHLEYFDIAPDRADLWFRMHGLFDAIFRLLIPLFIHLYPMDIIYLFPVCALTGLIFLTFTYGLLYTAIYPLAILPIVLFSFTSAVTTALQYTVSNQLFEKDQIEQGYVYHVIIMSLGSIIGPVIGGHLTDITKNYKPIIPLSMIFLVISFISFNATILLSNKKKVVVVERNELSLI